MNTKTYSTPNETSIFIIKLFYIFVIYMYFFIVAASISKIIDNSLPQYNDEEYSQYLEENGNYGKFMLLLEILATAGILGIGAYFTRNIVELLMEATVGKWVQGASGFDQSRVKERGGGIIIAFTFYLFQSNFKKKIEKLMF